MLVVAAEERAETYDIVGGAYRGVAAPRGTPSARVDKLAKEFVETIKIIADEQRKLGLRSSPLRLVFLTAPRRPKRRAMYQRSGK